MCLVLSLPSGEARGRKALPRDRVRDHPRGRAKRHHLALRGLRRNPVRPDRRAGRSAAALRPALRRPPAHSYRGGHHPPKPPRHHRVPPPPLIHPAGGACCATGASAAYRCCAVQGLTVLTPVFRSSLSFRVTTVSPRLMAVPASMAPGRWLSSDSPPPPPPGVFLPGCAHIPARRMLSSRAPGLRRSHPEGPGPAGQDSPGAARNRAGRFR